ncbi:MAG: hypothetical protein B7Z80_08875 [Rhodospirillales bacterium 20-64-7]|nr:MAG: hypothetical protein B7Z80_08875 [Rhodospirillales bacterium 20-64-7]
MAGLAIFSGIVVRVMIAIGVPDRPDARKAHRVVTPKSGGVGIVAAFLLGVLLLYRYGQVSRLAEPYFVGVIAAAFLIAAISLIDDLLDISFLIKLATQLLAGIAAVASGLWLHILALPYLGTVDIGWLGVPLTLFFLLFVTNAMNFIDGLNGLSAGVTLVACLFLAGIAGLYQGFFVYTAALLLAGGVLGFLPFSQFAPLRQHHSRTIHVRDDVVDLIKRIKSVTPVEGTVISIPLTAFGRLVELGHGRKFTHVLPVVMYGLLSRHQSRVDTLM